MTEKVDITGFNALETEKRAIAFNSKNRIVEKIRKKNKGKKKFYFLQGPPYTSGRLHMGHAWNNSLKDIIIRFRRMNNFDVWDRAGYDMHGLPTEHKVQEQFGIKRKEEIEKFGVEKFITECIKFSKEKAKLMDTDLQRLGISMDFENAYYPIKNEYIEGVWWLIKKAEENNRLYEGFKTISWCKSCATALAKHECEYQPVEETSIFVKFKVVGKDDEFLVIWTTTPWTIPFNLGIMVNPDLEYVKCKVITKENKTEYWIVAKALAGVFINSVAGLNFEIAEEFKGEKLEGLKYEHPFKDVIKEFAELEKEHKKIHTVLLSSEYVDTTAGSGLVHCAPGCGPEDYEVGYKNDLPAFNTIDEYGVFPKDWGEFAGLVAKEDDEKFVKALEKRNALIATSSVEHDYAHCERCHNPVVFRTTKQWFFKTEDLRTNMLEANKEVNWVPEAGKNAFNSWLSNLRDNSITKQRYWGSPAPIWKCDSCDKYEVVASRKDIEKLGGKVPENLHKPWIDSVIFKCTACKKGKMKRIPDVLDVWIDAGTASWNCLDHNNPELIKKLWPVDFILEAKEQVRGWFNLLMVASFVSMNKPCFENVYMHGMLTDVEGVKMSKSLGNVISPYEIVDKYGADTLRFYCCQTKAGEDMNFSWEEISLKNKKLAILWNIHKFLVDLAKNNKVNPVEINITNADVEEKYIISKLNSAIKKITNALNNYRIDESIAPLEELFLDLSRSYMQLIRDKSSVGSEHEKHLVIKTIYSVLIDFLKMFSVVCPFISENIYQNLRKAFDLKEESITFYSWPEYDNKKIDTALEKQFEIANATIQGILSAREKAQLGIRWPLKEAVVVTQNKDVIEACKVLESVIKNQTNVKSLKVSTVFSRIEEKIKPDYKKIGPEFGENSPKIIAKLALESPKTILTHIEKDSRYTLEIDKQKFNITKNHLLIEKKVPDDIKEGDYRFGSVYIDIFRTEELEAEGYARELMRRVQMLRKSAGLSKPDRISLFVKVPEELKEMIDSWNDSIKEKVGANILKISSNNPAKEHEHSSKEKIKGKLIEIFFNKE